ncbi:MAG: hypothetical protein IIB00_00800 [candidate division Zixibacteria bacterium]|nr:hypothetical protein [candidate division Zixibacteria bacterium]
MITSVGTLPYELALVQALKLGIPVKVCVTSSALERNADTLDSFRNKLAREFMINGAPLKVTLIPTRELDERDSQRLRDEFVLKNSNKIFLISIRPGGTLEEILNKSEQFIHRTDKTFWIPYDTTRQRVKKSYDPAKIDPVTQKLLEGHLIHWTRSCNTNWPGETRKSYIDSIVKSSAFYPRDAYRTLKRIIGEKVIRGSKRHMPAKQSAVSFTSATLCESVSLMKYRQRYREMTFEPFGIAIPQRTAESLGVRQVRYVRRSEAKKTKGDERLFVQTCDGARSDWPTEKEWRASGDFNLNGIKGDCILLADSSESARTISEGTGFRAQCVFSET